MSSAKQSYLKRLQESYEMEQDTLKHSIHQTQIMEEDVKRKSDLLTQIRQQGGEPNANRGTL